MYETYLTPKELSIIIKFSTQAIYNLIHKGTFINGVHYHKPSPKKILFKFSSIQNWIEGKELVGHGADISQSSQKQKNVNVSTESNLEKAEKKSLIII